MIKRTTRRLAQAMTIGVGLLFVPSATAAPPLTTIQDTLYRADGSLYSGYVQIEWKSFEASDKSVAPAQSLSLRVYNGQFRTRLIPTTNASPGAIYKIRYVSDGRIHAIESWAVPPSATPVRLTAVRVPSPGGVTAPGNAGTQVEISDVIGLQEALDTRPRKGAGFAAGRTAVINALGEIESALGADSDCITVEGTGAVCRAVDGSIAFIDGESPSGAVDGINAVFQLSNPPNPVSSLHLYRNGLFQRSSIDYTLNGGTITFASAATPVLGDLIVASYRISGGGSASPQILCSSVGSATLAPVATSLGTCTVPANVMRPGDRVEIWADYSHEGTGTGFNVDLKWGAASLISRNYPAGEANASIRLSLGAHTANSVFGGQSWGGLASPLPVAGSVVANYSTPLTVDFLANLTAAGTDGVTLRNFTVIRYPVP